MTLHTVIDSSADFLRFKWYEWAVLAVIVGVCVWFMVGVGL